MCPPELKRILSLKITRSHSVHISNSLETPDTLQQSLVNMLFPIYCTFINAFPLLTNLQERVVANISECSFLVMINCYKSIHSGFLSFFQTLITLLGDHDKKLSLMMWFFFFCLQLLHVPLYFISYFWRNGDKGQRAEIVCRTKPGVMETSCPTGFNVATLQSCSGWKIQTHVGVLTQRRTVCMTCIFEFSYILWPRSQTDATAGVHRG